MSTEKPEIVSLEKLAELRAEAKPTRRINYALGRGGSFDVYIFPGPVVVAAVPKPDELEEEVRGEIARAMQKERGRLAR